MIVFSFPGASALPDLNRLIADGKPVLIDFYREGCAPCRKISPIIDEVADLYIDEITVAKVNLSRLADAAEIADHFNLTAAPTIVFYAMGSELFRHVGAINADDLFDTLDEIMYG